MDVNSGNLKKKLKPKKKIVIRKFRKSSQGEKSIVQKIPKMSKLMKMLKSSKLTPAEFLYLSRFYSILSVPDGINFLYL